ncbi:hypothetical protein WOB59_00275 [Methylocystis sp. IM4]|uniref:hypothetical protein n=1 Tax=Methylocystis sp. IM4 TaxID=3136560 RepID=UPI0031199FB4
MREFKSQACAVFDVSSLTGKLSAIRAARAALGARQRLRLPLQILLVRVVERVSAFGVCFWLAQF